MPNANQIELFKNLSDWDLNPNNYRDLHNDFDCIGIELTQSILKLRFQGVAEGVPKLDMIFTAAELVRVGFSFEVPLSSLTLDNLHRGRFETNGSLVEADEEGRGYFYLEFYEGPTFEFWSMSVSLTDLAPADEAIRLKVTSGTRD